MVARVSKRGSFDEQEIGKNHFENLPTIRYEEPLHFVRDMGIPEEHPEEYPIFMEDNNLVDQGNF